MKKRHSIFLLFFTSSCVSIKDYRARQAELAVLVQGNKDLRKEIRVLEKERAVLLDTIQKRNARMQSMSIAIKKRLENNRIRASVNPKMLEGLTIFSPIMSAADYDYFMKMYPNRDTFSAKKVPWLSEKEKKIYYYLNYARLNPSGFCTRFVLPQWKKDTSDVYLITLMDYMYSMKPRNALVPDKSQFDNAKCHAVTSGEMGYVGHARQSKNCTSSFSGECCSYGLSDPLAVVMQLLIDRGVSSLGHRYICLGWYGGAGISMASHKGFGTNVVLDFR